MTRGGTWRRRTVAGHDQLGNVVLAQRHPVPGSLGGVFVGLANRVGQRLGQGVDLVPL